jgi:hypothetical protein
MAGTVLTAYPHASADIDAALAIGYRFVLDAPTFLYGILKRMRGPVLRVAPSAARPTDPASLPVHAIAN